MSDNALSDLPLGQVRSITADRSLCDAAAALTESGAELLVIHNDDQRLGVLSPRGLLAAFAACRNPDSRAVSDFIEAMPPMIAASASVKEADKLLSAQNSEIALVADQHDAPLGLISINTINRAMHVADKNLRLSGASLRTLINTIPDLIWLKDPQGRYLACNTEFERLYGTSEEDILGKDDFTFVSPEKAEFFRHNDQAAAEAGDSRRSEEWVTYASDGHRALLDTRKTPIFDTDGSLIGVLGVGHDITAQRAAEETLRRNTSYQSALLDNFPFLVWLKDTDSRFLAVNRPFAEAAGFTAADDVIGKTDLDIWPGELAEAYRADDRSVMASLQKRSVEEEIVTDSERRWHATYKAPVLDKEGALLGTVGFAMDITPRKTVDLENQHQLAELRRWHEATLGREGRILELKQEINSLLIKHGLTPRYPSAVETPTPVDSQGTAADV